MAPNPPCTRSEARDPDLLRWPLPWPALGAEQPCVPAELRGAVPGGRAYNYA
jgi:hypothetical protein